jgi:hypothetical protein
LISSLRFNPNYFLLEWIPLLPNQPNDLPDLAEMDQDVLIYNANLLIRKTGHKDQLNVQKLGIVVDVIMFTLLAGNHIIILDLDGFKIVDMD